MGIIELVELTCIPLFSDKLSKATKLQVITILFIISL